MARRSTPTDLPADAPIRTCVGCRAKASRADLLRVVAVEVGTQGSVRTVLVPDPRRVRPGRGASLHPVSGCLDAAERRRAFVRALRLAGVPDTSSVRDHLEQQAHRQQEQ